MKLIDAYFALPVIRLHIICNCDALLDHPSNISLVVCPRCRRAELWHGVGPPAGQP